MCIYIYLWTNNHWRNQKWEQHKGPNNPSFELPTIQRSKTSLSLSSLSRLILFNSRIFQSSYLSTWKSDERMISFRVGVILIEVSTAELPFQVGKNKLRFLMVSKRKGIVAGNSVTRIWGWSRGSLRFRLFCFILFIIVIHQFDIWSIILLCCQSFRLTLETKKDSDLRHSDATLHRDVVAKRSAGSTPPTSELKASASSWILSMTRTFDSACPRSNGMRLCVIYFKDRLTGSRTVWHAQKTSKTLISLVSWRRNWFWIENDRYRRDAHQQEAASARDLSPLVFRLSLKLPNFLLSTSILFLLFNHLLQQHKVHRTTRSPNTQ